MKTIILAAGKGSRLESESYDLPKALRNLNCLPLISYVLNQITFSTDIIVVVGYEREKVVDYVTAHTHGKAQFAVQEVQDGTARAVLSVEEAGLLEGYDGDVMVVYCDMPLIKAETYSSMAYFHKECGADFTLLTAKIDPPPAYGRIVRGARGRVVAVVEERNATPEQKLITEVNVGVQVAKWNVLQKYLHKVSNENPQGEYILTEAAALMANDGLFVNTVETNDIKQAMGVNTMDELRACEEIIRLRQSEA